MHGSVNRLPIVHQQALTIATMIVDGACLCTCALHSIGTRVQLQCGHR